MQHARYSCSHSTTRQTWWFITMRPKEMARPRVRAASRTAGECPLAPPIANVATRSPLSAQSCGIGDREVGVGACAPHGGQDLQELCKLERVKLVAALIQHHERALPRADARQDVLALLVALLVDSPLRRPRRGFQRELLHLDAEAPHTFCKVAARLLGPFLLLPRLHGHFLSSRCMGMRPIREGRTVLETLMTRKLRPLRSPSAPTM